MRSFHNFEAKQFFPTEPNAPKPPSLKSSDIQLPQSALFFQARFAKEHEEENETRWIWHLAQPTYLTVAVIVFLFASTRQFIMPIK